MNANLEEAANVATEYLASLENLPNEAQHILAEIKYRDTRTQDLNEEIRKETQKYYRHAAKNAGQSLSTKDAAIPDSVGALYAEIDTLAGEKAALADRLVRIFQRASARLQHDLHKIRRLQGEEPELTSNRDLVGSVDSAIQQIQNSLRSLPAAVEPLPAAASASASAAAPPRKKQRVTGSGSIKLPSPVPVSVSSGTYGGASASGTQKSGLSRQVHPRQSPVRSRRVPTTGMDDDDAEGEEDEDGADAEDQELYCYCQKLSYGEMIACDNESCRFQWFHLSCINLPSNENLPETWYCDECSVMLGIATTNTQAASGGTRKGRKK